MKPPQAQHARQGMLLALDGVSGGALKAAAHDLRTDGHRGAGISEWDASGIFGDLTVAERDAGAPSARVLLLLYAADLAFRLRWEIRPALAKGRVVIAIPYVDTALAFGRAAGLPTDWVRNLFGFAPPPAESRHVAPPPGSAALGSRTPRSGTAQREGFVEFGCRHVSGTPRGLSREELMARTRAYLRR